MKIVLFYTHQLELELLKAAIESRGYEIMGTFTHVNDLSLFLMQQSPNLLVFDFSFFHTINWINPLVKRHPLLPILGLHSIALENNLKKWEASGVTHFLSKNCSVKELCETFEAVVMMQNKRNVVVLSNSMPHNDSVRNVLERRGYCVLNCENEINGNSTSFHDNRLDPLLTDLLLFPERDFKIAKVINDRFPWVKVLFYKGPLMKEHTEILQNEGFAKFVLNYIPEDDLYSCIESMLENNLDQTNAEDKSKKTLLSKLQRILQEDLMPSFQLTKVEHNYNIKKETRARKVSFLNLEELSIKKMEFRIPPYHTCNVEVVDAESIFYYNFKKDDNERWETLFFSSLFGEASINSLLFDYEGPEDSCFLEWKTTY